MLEITIEKHEKEVFATTTKPSEDELTLKVTGNYAEIKNLWRKLNFLYKKK